MGHRSTPRSIWRHVPVNIGHPAQFRATAALRGHQITLRSRVSYRAATAYNWLAMISPKTATPAWTQVPVCTSGKNSSRTILPSFTV